MTDSDSKLGLSGFPEDALAEHQVYEHPLVKR